MANAGEWQQAKLNCCSSVFFGFWKEDVENGLWMLWGSFQTKEIKGGVAGQVNKTERANLAFAFFFPFFPFAEIVE